MVYVALLRGINVGGKNKVEMAKLRSVFESIGCGHVKTYINSGNVIFSDERAKEVLQPLIEKAFAENFEFTIKLLLVNQPTFDGVHEALPADWQNDSTMKCDVLFLWDSKNNKDALDELIIKPGIDNVKYVNGAILWCVKRENVTKSGMMKIVGTELYKQMTARNCNTVRKVYGMMREIGENA